MAGITLDRITADAELEDGGTLVHVLGPDGEPQYFGPGKDKPVTITVAGALSKTFRRAERAFNAKIGKQAQRGAGLTAILDHRTVETTAGCILAWDGFFYDAGETRPLELTHEHAVAVLEAAPYILAQLLTVMGDHASFFGTASRPS